MVFKPNLPNLLVTPTLVIPTIIDVNIKGMIIILSNLIKIAPIDTENSYNPSSRSDDKMNIKLFFIYVPRIIPSNIEIKICQCSCLSNFFIFKYKKKGD